MFGGCHLSSIHHEQLAVLHLDKWLLMKAQPPWRGHDALHEADEGRRRQRQGFATQFKLQMRQALLLQTVGTQRLQHLAHLLHCIVRSRDQRRSCVQHRAAAISAGNGNPLALRHQMHVLQGQSPGDLPNDRQALEGRALPGILVVPHGQASSTAVRAEADRQKAQLQILRDVVIQISQQKVGRLLGLQMTLDAGGNSDVPLLQLVVQGLQIVQLILRLLLHGGGGSKTQNGLETGFFQDLHLCLLHQPDGLSLHMQSLLLWANVQTIKGVAAQGIATAIAQLLHQPALRKGLALLGVVALMSGHAATSAVAGEDH
mmetsp:Transcript_68989/g.108794  ORF Transcript_68989/g.108794 Transcript_68989/m.108794 type:complete len:316 (+) Transcript_68989:297-1244(+)